ncbi:MAG: methyltransferase domain-containing protein [Patescibacteria group bacterium]
MKSSDWQKLIYQGEKNPSAYDREILKKNKIRLQKIQSYVAEEEGGKKILEIGCATGLISQIFCAENEVCGLDLSDDLLAGAKSRGLRTVKADLEEELPFKNDRFDLIIASEIIEHVIDTDKLLCEINRVLKKDGKLILSVPNLRNFFSPWLLLFFDRPPVYSARYRSPHVRDFTYPLIKKALSNNGFKIMKKTGSNFYLPFFWRLANSRLSSLFGRLFPTWSKELIVKAVKIKSSDYQPKEIFLNYKKGRL